MIVTKEDLATLRSAVEPLDTDDLRDRYRRLNTPLADRVHDLNKRYRWELLWRAFYDDAGVQAIILSDYADAHIDTALRRIVPVL